MYNKIEKVEEQNNYCGVTAWHDAGFTGEGVHIWNCEDLSSHGEVSTRRIYDAAPGAITHNAVISVKRNREKIYYFYVTDENGKRWEPEEFIEAHNIKILSRSKIPPFAQDGAYFERWQRLQDKYSLVLFNSSGNDAGDAKNRKDGTDLAVLVGALNLIKGKVGPASYTSVTDDTDFADFTGVWSGTSFSCPYLAGKAALLVSRYGQDMTQEEVYKYLQMIARDEEAEGRDAKTGYGLPILPDISKRYITMTTSSNVYKVNGSEYEMDTRPVNLDGRVYVPIRVIGEALGADVGYKMNPNKTIKVLIDRAGAHIELNTNSNAANINGKTVYMDAEPFIDSNNRTLVPIRFIAEAFGCTVDWVQNEAKVIILEG